MDAQGEIRDPLIGARIDNRYVVHGVLGRGGMGVVYEGVHEQLGRQVAIKVLGPGIAGDPKAVQRFLREARTASQLTHGNIVDVSDMGSLPDGRPYLVMAKQHGVDLNTLLRQRGPQTPRRTGELLRGAAAALDLIHAKGFVHRDVKPENLMHVVREDGSEAVLLLDFGIVGLVSPDSSRLTAEGVVFGTPVYLAPEVIRGAVPSPRSDTYSLATVAFELMTGQPPFSQRNTMQLMQSKLVDAPPRPSAIAGFEIPEGIEGVLAKGLERDPNERYPSAGAFVTALLTAVQRHSSVALPAVGVSGLDPAARQRLQSGTAALEMSFGEADPGGAATLPSDRAAQAATTVRSDPPNHAARAIRSDPPDGTLAARWSTGPRKGKRAPLAAVLSGCALLMLGGWLLLHSRESAAPTLEPSAPPTAADEPQPSAAPPTASPPAIPEGTAAPEEPARVVESKRPTGKRKATQQGTMPVTAAAPEQPPPAAAAGPSVHELVESAQRELVSGHLGASADLYQRVSQLDPNNAAAFRGLGLINERLGRNAEAIRALKRALALAPNDAKSASLAERIARLEAAH